MVVCFAAQDDGLMEILNYMKEQNDFKIIIVTDNHLIFEKLSLLIAEEYSRAVVRWSGSRGDAVDDIRSGQPRLVLLDIHLPGAGGIHVLERIMEMSPRPKVFVFSEEHLPQYRNRAVDMGADGFYFLPMAWETLLADISGVVSSRT